MPHRHQVAIMMIKLYTHAIHKPLASLYLPNPIYSIHRLTIDMTGSRKILFIYIYIYIYLKQKGKVLYLYDILFVIPKH